MAILKKPKKPKDMGTYNRTDAQRKPEDWSERGDLERGYARSSMNAEPIQYPDTGNKL